ncbi:MAG: NAD-dependent epimerase/dehydratase family protein, partial [Lautropia sp.]|nr:NAD-dependent epimerase/dehydratase family protein [Lautropia sp.]
MGLRPPHYCALPRLFRRRRLLIIGCGDIGRRLAALVGKEWRVYGVGRSSETLAQIRTVGAVPLDARAGRRRLQDLADWVVHSAPPPANAEHRASASSRGVGTRSRSEPIDKLTREWTARLLQPPRPVERRNHASWRLGSRPLKPKRLVYLSTTGVYGDRQGRMTLETSAVSPTTDRARRRVDAEQWLRDTCRRSPGLQVTTLRVPGIYAADRLPIGRLQERLPALLPQADVQTNHIHADDLARMTRIALMRGRSQRRLNIVDDSN